MLVATLLPAAPPTRAAAASQFSNRGGQSVDLAAPGLGEFGGNYIAAEMVKAFISSAEYRKRFEP
ncbi:MAG TPA: hypothetical protein VF570_23000 [Pyrinomonadaceae bacterium]